jgi:hypothetical protein
MRCRLPAPFKQEARDDVLGGIPTTAIAGPFPAFTFQVKLYHQTKCRLFNTVHVLNQWPERQGDPGGGAEKFNAELQRNNREEKKRAAAIAFERERGYKKKVQRKRSRR